VPILVPVAFLLVLHSSFPVAKLLQATIETIASSPPILGQQASTFGEKETVSVSQAFSPNAILESLRGRLIVSCQASAGDPLDHLDTLTRIAASVLRGGAGGLRAEGVSRIAAFRARTDLPIIGIIKAYDANGDVYITPDFQSAHSISHAGADIIALDCTRRRLAEPEPWPEIISRIHNELARPVCADIATLDDALAAQRAGADVVATTLYGYTADTAGSHTPPWTLIQVLIAELTIPVIVEGHITQPQEVRKALDLGAHCVVVGSAITRPQTITARFVEATQQP
jgi:N-acylglucosamine-6-phosphate 2-epimerase